MTSWALDCKLRLNFGGSNSGREVPCQTVSDPITCEGSGGNVVDEGSDSDSTWCEEAERITGGQPRQDSTDTAGGIVSLTDQLSMKDEEVAEMLEANLVTQDSEALMDCALAGQSQLGVDSQQDARAVDAPRESARQTSTRGISDSTRYSLRDQPKRNITFDVYWNLSPKGNYRERLKTKKRNKKKTLGSNKNKCRQDCSMVVASKMLSDFGVEVTTWLSCAAPMTARRGRKLLRALSTVRDYVRRESPCSHSCSYKMNSHKRQELLLLAESLCYKLSDFSAAGQHTYTYECDRGTTSLSSAESTQTSHMQPFTEDEHLLAQVKPTSVQREQFHYTQPESTEHEQFKHIQPESTQCEPLQYIQPESTQCEQLQYIQPESTQCEQLQYIQPESTQCEPLQYIQPESTQCEQLQYIQPESTQCEPLQYIQPESTQCEQLQYIQPESTQCEPLQYIQPESTQCEPLQYIQPESTQCEPLQYIQPESTQCEPLQYMQPESTQCEQLQNVPSTSAQCEQLQNMQSTSKKRKQLQQIQPTSTKHEQLQHIQSTSTKRGQLQNMQPMPTKSTKLKQLHHIQPTSKQEQLPHVQPVSAQQEQLQPVQPISISSVLKNVHSKPGYCKTLPASCQVTLLPKKKKQRASKPELDQVHEKVKILNLEKQTTLKSKKRSSKEKKRMEVSSDNVTESQFASQSVLKHSDGAAESQSVLQYGQGTSNKQEYSGRVKPGRDVEQVEQDTALDESTTGEGGCRSGEGGGGNLPDDTSRVLGHAGPAQREEREVCLPEGPHRLFAWASSIRSHYIQPHFFCLGLQAAGCPDETALSVSRQT